jgi:putative DNA primase/helicase
LVSYSYIPFRQRSDSGDLKTGKLSPHSSDQLNLKRVLINYNPDAKCPTWHKFLGDIFLGDKELIGWVERALGYSLTGSIAEQVMFILYGRGENGKTKFIETVGRILGEGALSTQFDTFLTDAKMTNVRNLTAVGELKGVRFAYASETKAGAWDESLFKKLTGGDTLTGCYLHRPEFRFQPTHKLWFLCNRIPAFKDGSHGFRRRPLVIPFRAQFSGEKRDKNIFEKLWAEREGILARLVDGAVRYHKHGLADVPKAMADLTDAYLDQHDPLTSFIKDCLCEDPQVGMVESLTGQEMRVLYLKWCSSCGESPQPENYFRANLEEWSVIGKRSARGIVYRGWKPRPSNWRDKGNGISVFEPDPPKASEPPPYEKLPPRVKAFLKTEEEYKAWIKSQMENREHVRKMQEIRKRDPERLATFAKETEDVDLS